MTQTSWPWDGTTVGDATDAPYDDQEWDLNERILYASGGNVGVVPAPYNLNKLYVTESGTPAMTVDVDTGAALVYGKRYENSGSVTLAIESNPSSTRYDRIVLCMNRQDTDYTGVTPNVTPNTIRAAVLKGTPGGAAPALTQTANTVYMIPLAQVIVVNGETAIADDEITDEREFAGVGTQREIARWQPVGVPVSNFAFGAIPATFTHLMLEFIGRGTASADDVELTVNFNVDFASNYAWVTLTADGSGSVSSTGNNAATGIVLGRIVAATGWSTMYDGYMVHIPNYVGAGFYKSALAWGQNTAGGFTNDLEMRESRGWWKNTAAITSITVSLSSGAFDTYTLCKLYGIV